MSPKRTGQRLLGYIRQSREKEGSISESLQRQAIETWAANPANGVASVDFLEADLDWSGKDLERPAMREALALLADKKYDGIVAAKLDRFSRNVGDFAYLLRVAREEDWNLIAIDLGVDLATSNGRMIAQMLGVLAEWELDRRGEGWKETRTSAVKRGVYAAPTPFGYLRDEGRLVPDPENARFVTEAFARRAMGETLVDIAAWLNESGATKKVRHTKDEKGRKVVREATPFLDREVAALLNREAYLGVSQTADGGRNDDAHDPLVDHETFLRAQAARKTNGKAGETHRPNADHPLIGRVVCAECGHRMSRKTNRRGQSNEQVQWRCTTSSCTARASISGPNLEPYVLVELASTATAYLDAPDGDFDDRLDAARARLDAAELELGAFTLVAKATDSGYAEAVDIRRQAVEDAKADLAAIPVETTDWRSDVRAEVAKWNKLGLNLDADKAVALDEAMYKRRHETGVTGAELLEVLKLGGKPAQQIVRHVLRRVRVSGSKGGVAGRVEVELLDGGG